MTTSNQPAWDVQVAQNAVRVSAPGYPHSLFKPVIGSITRPHLVFLLSAGNRERRKEVEDYEFDVRYPQRLANEPNYAEHLDKLEITSPRAPRLVLKRVWGDGPIRTFCLYLKGQDPWPRKSAA